MDLTFTKEHLLFAYIALRTWDSVSDLYLGVLLPPSGNNLLNAVFSQCFTCVPSLEQTTYVYVYFPSKYCKLKINEHTWDAAVGFVHWAPWLLSTGQVERLEDTLCLGRTLNWVVGQCRDSC